MSEPQRPITLELVGRIIFGGLAIVLGAVFVVVAQVVVRSRFGPPMSDPHGYGLIFGSIIGIPVAFAAALIAPLAFPRPLRLAVLAVSMSVFVLCTAALLGMLFTA